MSPKNLAISLALAATVVLPADAARALDLVALTDAN
jgi:hypothetical protein